MLASTPNLLQMCSICQFVTVCPCGNPYRLLHSVVLAVVGLRLGFDCAFSCHLLQLCQVSLGQWPRALHHIQLSIFLSFFGSPNQVPTGAIVDR
ncbi:hypothetical protein TYRP_013528 [Tyrophagus putrescentiae]|nr:hypothetical protein TYRP_013528 [Tyrophagus putrescentiae]